MSRTIRMIGVDLDGTLLNSEKQLTAYTREVLKKAIEDISIDVKEGEFLAIVGASEMCIRDRTSSLQQVVLEW